jgi:multidrug resistance efflux pump
MLSEQGVEKYALECPTYADLSKARANWNEAYANLDEAYANLDKARANLSKADAEGKIFWKVFSNPLNRIEVWR